MNPLFLSSSSLPPNKPLLPTALRAGRRIALMCAETLWWRCHRRLLADALVARGAEVIHLLGPGARAVHALHPAARLDGDGRLIYDRGAQATLPLGDPGPPRP